MFFLLLFLKLNSSIILYLNTGQPMFSFISRFFERRRQRKASIIVLNALHGDEFSKWFSYTTFSTGEKKVPLKIKHIKFDENTLLYSALLYAPFENEFFSFAFKVQIDHYYSTSFTVVDLADKSNYVSWVDQSSDRLKGAFLYYGVKEELIKALRVYSSAKKTPSSVPHTSKSSSTTNDSYRNNNFANDPMYQNERALTDLYVTTLLISEDDNSTSYDKHPSTKEQCHSNNDFHSHSHSCGSSSSGGSDSSSSSSSSSD